MVTDGNGNGIVMEWVGYQFGNGNGNGKRTCIWIFLDFAVDAPSNVNTHNGK